MTTIMFLVEWAVRSSILILGGALLLRVLRVKDSSICLAAWVAMLGGSLAIPALTAVLPGLPLTMTRSTLAPVAARTVEVPQAAPYEPAPEPAPTPMGSRSEDRVPEPFDWARAALILYVVVSGSLLLRVAMGLQISLRLLRTSRPTELIGARESERVAAPVTLGMVRPAIVLPGDWRQWESMKLEAVLAHERSHVRRRDPAVQLVSVMHRALLWISPLSWFLHKRLVRAAEEVSDDAAVTATRDRASYAEVLLDFMQRGVWGSGLVGVPMARYGSPDQRINRILDATTVSRGITRWSVAAIVALGSPLAYVVATGHPQSAPLAQPQNVAQLQLPIPAAPLAPAPQAFQARRSAASEPTFDTVDIHASAPNTIPRMRSGFSRGRYELGNATMVDLIRTAWGVDADKVAGGPGWLETDRFDVIATAPPSSTPETLKSMLRALLEDRFQLAAHKDTKGLPAYVMTAGKKPQLKPSDGSEESGCTVDAGRTPRDQVVLTCRNMTMTAFANDIPNRWPASDYVFNYRVVDRTGLKGAWNFSVKYNRRAAGQPAAAETISLFDAFENQLGLKLALTKVPTPVVVVDSVKKPAGNPPGVTEKLPEFEVASIKPDAPGVVTSNVGIRPGGRVTIQMTLKGLIWEAWGNLNPDRIIGGSKSMDATGWVIVAKAPAQEDAPAGWSGPVWNGVDVNSMRMMLRALLMDRFRLAAHTEDRLVDGYELVAEKPRLRRADPSNRPGCKEGPGADGAGPNWKDPRIANPAASRLVTCRNMTLAQFAAELSKPTTEENPILFNFPPVVDATGIDGKYDMTINFSPPAVVLGRIDWGGPIAGGGALAQSSGASDPDGTISIFEALEKQLGLKLKSRKVTAPVLVIDHVDEMPSEN